MTTDPDDPVIIAIITTAAAGEPAGPLLIDGTHRLYKAAVTGREHLRQIFLVDLSFSSGSAAELMVAQGRAGGGTGVS